MPSIQSHPGLPGRLATIGMVVGSLAVAAGATLVLWSLARGALPGWSAGEGAALSRAMATLPGVVLCLVGLGLVLRSLHLRATLETLSAVRTLQQGLRQTVPLSREPIRAEATAPDAPAPARPPAAAVAVPELRASKANPIKGKPFTPHPIFMARPPR